LDETWIYRHSSFKSERRAKLIVPSLVGATASESERRRQKATGSDRTEKSGNGEARLGDTRSQSRADDDDDRELLNTAETRRDETGSAAQTRARLATG
jgi:hypothetical protein